MLLRLTAISIFFVLAAGESPPPDRFRLEDRIIGGIDSPITDFPHQVSLHYDGTPYCGGSIIGPRHILTAAHCTQGLDVSSIEVRVGSSQSRSGGTLFQIEEKHEHPDFVLAVYDNDIAILKLAQRISFSSSAKVIKYSKDHPLKAGTLAQVSGWGVTQEEDNNAVDQLQSVDVPLLPWSKCKKQVEALDKVLTSSMICAGYADGQKDACRGDSGGPLVQDNILIGVVSWGYGCARAKSPGVYTNVARFAKFIDKIIGT